METREELYENLKAKGMILGVYQLAFLFLCHQPSHISQFSSQTMSSELEDVQYPRMTSPTWLAVDGLDGLVEPGLQWFIYAPHAHPPAGWARLLALLV